LSLTRGHVLKSVRSSFKPVRFTAPPTLTAARGALAVRVSGIAGDELQRRALGRRAMRVILALLGLAAGRARDGSAQALPIAKRATLAVVGDAAIAWDGRTTFLALRRGATESNVVLGPHPNNGALIGYFVAASAAYTASVITLPKPWRYVVAIGVVGLESVCVAENLRWQATHGY
jgi:hypothetical protein